jgi:hypothetical protein
MSSLIHWQVADGRAKELRQIEASVDAHPFARFLLLQFPPITTRRRAAATEPGPGSSLSSR